MGVGYMTGIPFSGTGCDKKSELMRHLGPTQWMWLQASGTTSH